MEAKNIIRLSVFFALLISFTPVTIKAAAPSAITDLQCSYSGTPGNIQLSWTVPAGSPTGYELHYDLLNITDANFNNATPFDYGWSGSDKSVLVTGFAQNENWYFGIKAINADGVSAVSNIVSCQANTVVGVNAATYPSSAVSNLVSGSEIPAGVDFLVKGISSDQGGSSIQKVEISFDNGLTWQTTLPVKSTATGFNWQYNWAAPKAGDYLIKTRATDWLGSLENPSSSLSVKVAGGQIATTTTTSTSTTTSQSDQQRRNLLIEIIRLLLQILSGSRLLVE